MIKLVKKIGEFESGFESGLGQVRDQDQVYNRFT